MNLDIVESCEHYEDNKIRLNLPIYLRKNETFFVRMSFLWRRESIMTTMLLFWNTAVSSDLFVSLVSLNFQVKKSQKYFHFSFVLCTNVVSVQDQIESINYFEIYCYTIEMIETYQYWIFL